MQYQVFVQNLAEQRFVALVMGMPTVSEYGATEEEAALETQLARGRLITIELPQTAAEELKASQKPPTTPHFSSLNMQQAGIFADDPSFDDWVEKLAQIRAEANAETDD